MDSSLFPHFIVLFAVRAVVLLLCCELGGSYYVANLEAAPSSRASSLGRSRLETQCPVFAQAVHPGRSGRSGGGQPYGGVVLGTPTDLRESAPMFFVSRKRRCPPTDQHRGSGGVDALMRFPEGGLSSSTLYRTTDNWRSMRLKTRPMLDSEALQACMRINHLLTYLRN